MEEKTRNLSVLCLTCLRIAQDLRQSPHRAVANSDEKARDCYQRKY